MRFWVRVWDSLFVLLVLLPLLTGGVWIKRPGLHLELSELAIPTFILALLAWPIREALSQGSFAVHGIRKVWNAWNGAVSRSPCKILLCSALVIGAFWATIAIWKHLTFGSSALDFSIFLNAAWNLTHGNGYYSSVKDGMQLFIDHQSPILWLIAWVSKPFPMPEAFLVLQALGLASGGVAVYFVARGYLGDRHRALALLPVMYWMYLPVRSANAFDFHPETFMLGFFLWGIAGLQGKTGRSRALGGLSLLLALSGKESSGIILFGVALAWILGAAPEASRAFTRRIAPALAVLGVGLFLFDTKVVPSLLGGEYPHSKSYAHLGGGLGDLALAPFRMPGEFFSHLLGESRLRFLLLTLAPLAFLPLGAPRVLVAAVPSWAALFLSQGDHRMNLNYYYALEPAVALFWAMGPAIARYEKKPFAKALPAAALLAFWALAASGRSDMMRFRENSMDDHKLWVRAELLPSVAKDVTLSASGALGPHLSERRWIHHLPQIQMKQGPLASEGGPVDCVIEDRKLNNYPMNAEGRALLMTWLSEIGYEEEFGCGSVRVHRRPGGPACLARVPSCPEERS